MRVWQDYVRFRGRGWRRVRRRFWLLGGCQCRQILFRQGSQRRCILCMSIKAYQRCSIRRTGRVYNMDLPIHMFQSTSRYQFRHNSVHHPRPPIPVWKNRTCVFLHDHLVHAHPFCLHCLIAIAVESFPAGHWDFFQVCEVENCRWTCWYYNDPFRGRTTNSSGYLFSCDNGLRMLYLIGVISVVYYSLRLSRRRRRRVSVPFWLISSRGEGWWSCYLGYWSSWKCSGESSRSGLWYCSYGTP